MVGICENSDSSITHQIMAKIVKNGVILEEIRMEQNRDSKLNQGQ